MGIEVYEGVLGGGKSYHAVKHALEYLAHGGRVYTNIALVESACKKWCASRYGVELDWVNQYRFLSGSDMANLHKIVVGGTSDSPTLCILDEIHLYHNARDWAQASRGLLQWLTQSRKLHVDIICITQHRNNLDKQWVRLVYRYWRFRDLRKFRLPKIGLKIPFFQCLATSFDIDGRTQLEKRWERFDNSVFGCYSSEQLFDGVSDFAGSGLKPLKLKKAKVKIRWKLVVCLSVALCAVGCGCGKLLSPLLKSHRSCDASSSDVPSVSAEASPPVSFDGVPPPLVPPSDPYVECASYWAKDGRIVGGCNIERGLIFEGKPDKQSETTGLPCWHVARGTRI